MADFDNLLKKKDLTRKVMDEISHLQSQFDGQRDEYEDQWEAADYMYRCAQNRSLNTSDKDKGANLGVYDDNTELANTGSTSFHRMIDQLASKGWGVQNSRDVPWKYKPIINMNIQESIEEADEQANQVQMLAKWTMKQDKFSIKSIGFWNQLTKYGNLPVMVEQCRETKELPVYNENGELEGYEEFITKNYPSFRVLPIASVYADAQIGCIQDQNLVCVVSLQNKSKLWAGVRAGYYDKKAVKEATKDESMQWDGSSERDHIDNVQDNQDLTENQIKATTQYLVWDFFYRAPIDEKGKYNEEDNPDRLFWLTSIGNTVQNSTVIRFERNPDPDDEIPIEMIKSTPDDAEQLYCMGRSQIIRSNYSVECTLKNQAIDRGTLIARPPVVEKEGSVRGDDRSFKPNANWTVENIGDIDVFTVPDITDTQVRLLDWIEADSRSALGVDKNDMGESFGARTSANEASIINRSNAAPQFVNNKYVLDQFLGFYARKMWSYWDSFALEDQIIAITDEEKFQTVQPALLHGQFDVEVDIVDDFEETEVQSKRLFDAINLVSSNPELAKNVNIPEMLKEYFMKQKLNAAKFVKPPTDADAGMVARQENIDMMQNNIPATIKPGENLDVHLAEHKGERLRYRGIEDQYPSVQLLDQHIEETKLAAEQQGAEQGPPAPAGNGNATEGQVAGNEIAGALGT